MLTDDSSLDCPQSTTGVITASPSLGSKKLLRHSKKSHRDSRTSRDSVSSRDSFVLKKQANNKDQQNEVAPLLVNGNGCSKDDEADSTTTKL